jgi:hypothetical protein
LQQRRPRQQSLADGVDVESKLRLALSQESGERWQQLQQSSALQTTADLAVLQQLLRI